MGQTISIKENVAFGKELLLT